jgi:hypothetical protein
MIQIKNITSFGSFLYFVFFKRVSYCWSIILMFNNIFSNNELISNRFAVFVTCTHILTYLPTCETGYWSIFIYVYMTGCVKCHVHFSTFVFANESWFFLCRVLSFIPVVLNFCRTVYIDNTKWYIIVMWFYIYYKEW